MIQLVYGPCARVTRALFAAALESALPAPRRNVTEAIIFSAVSSAHFCLDTPNASAEPPVAIYAGPRGAALVAASLYPRSLSTLAPVRRRDAGDLASLLHLRLVSLAPRVCFGFRLCPFERRGVREARPYLLPRDAPQVPLATHLRANLP